jgi:hypothetical protein
VTRRAWLWLRAATLYSLLLGAIFCARFEPIGDLQQIRARYDGLLRLPFV